MTTLVLFDLDDTLFDHKYCRLCGLQALKDAHEALTPVPIEALEREHEALLCANYTKVLDGKMSMAEARMKRTRSLFARFGAALGEAEAIRYARIYREAYDMNRRAVPGVTELLQALRKRVKTGIVSNGLADAQNEKVRICALEGLIDFLTISEEAGCRKPERGIFEAALGKAGSRAEETVYIGDSWENDILGAANCGIRAVWLNRYGYERGEEGLCMEIHSYEHRDDILRYIFGGQDGPGRLP